VYVFHQPIPEPSHQALIPKPEQRPRDRHNNTD
jgi:hypothetical protein